MGRKKWKNIPRKKPTPPKIAHSADRRNIVGIPAVQNLKFKKNTRRPTAY